LSYNPYFSAYFFSQNSNFLSQQINEQYFQPWLFSEANGLIVVLVFGKKGEKMENKNGRTQHTHARLHHTCAHAATHCCCRCCIAYLLP
jgi:hypothetical protein